MKLRTHLNRLRDGFWLVSPILIIAAVVAALGWYARRPQLPNFGFLSIAEPVDSRREEGLRRFVVRTTPEHLQFAVRGELSHAGFTQVGRPEVSAAERMWVYRSTEPGKSPYDIVVIRQSGSGESLPAGHSVVELVRSGASETWFASR